MIVFMTEHPDYGWITHETLKSALDEIEMEIDANSLVPCEITIKVKIVEMSQEKLDALPSTDD